MLSQLLTDELLYRTVAAVVAIAFVALRLRAPAWIFGPQGRFWNPLRRVVVPILDRLARQHLDEATGGEINYAQYELDNSEYVGRVEASVGAFERELHDAGFTRMPLASLKELPDGQIERGSWARRDGLMASRQTHAMHFDSPAGESGIDVYAHAEPNATNPLTAWVHYSGVNYSPSEGVAEVRAFLDESAFEWSPSG